jgi:DNA-directed RNA polymerase specialized sigma subunit
MTSALEVIRALEAPMGRPNPVDNYLSEKEKAAAASTALDMQVFETWKSSPTKRNTRKLLKRFDSEVNKRVGWWKADNVNEAAFRANLQKNAIKAFQTYDPMRGASLRTHVNNMLKRSQRFNATYQNVAKIPEDKIALITPIQKARDQLRQQFDSPPDNKAIANFLNQNPALVPVKRVRGRVTPGLVNTVQAYQIKDIAEEKFESDPVPQAASFERETLRLLRHVLSSDDRNVYDYLYGAGGKKQVTSTGEIARRLGKSPSAISRAKARIRGIYLQHTGGKR